MSERRRVRSRAGFTMITMLWVITVAFAVTAAAALDGRTTFNATRNRVQAERALWTALGCAHRVQAAIDIRLRGAATLDDAAAVWQRLDRRIAAELPLSDRLCQVQLEAAGSRLDINSASTEMLINVLGALGESDASASALAAAVEDWRDSDDVPRPLGAERDWYVNARRAAPSNAPFSDLRELALVRGFEDLTRFDTLLSADSGRVSLATAPVTVLRAVPGFTAETAELLASSRDAEATIGEPASLVERLSVESRDAMLARYAEILRVTTSNPDAWMLTTRSFNGKPRSVVMLRWRLIRTGRRCVVVASHTTS